MGMQGTDSTTEAEVTSLTTGQMMEGVLALKSLDTVIDLLESLASQPRRDPLRQPTHKTLNARQESSDRATSDMTCASHLTPSVFSQTRSINLQWQPRSYDTSTRETSRFGGGPMVESLSTSGGSGSKTSNTCENHIDTCNV